MKQWSKREGGIGRQERRLRLQWGGREGGREESSKGEEKEEMEAQFKMAKGRMGELGKKNEGKKRGEHTAYCKHSKYHVQRYRLHHVK